MAKPTLTRLVVATHNRKKAGEMIQILTARFPGLELLTLADYPDAPEPEETGTTYAENASIKAQSAAVFTGEYSLADDAGLEIDAMGGEPGLHSKRFEGEDTPFPEKIALILSKLQGVPEAGRRARFRCCVALAGPDNSAEFQPLEMSPMLEPGSMPPVYEQPVLTMPLQVFEAICEGRIVEAPSGNGGFGYDPIFYLPEQGGTMADLTAEQKHQVSHRGKVLKELGDYLATSFEIGGGAK